MIIIQVDYNKMCELAIVDVDFFDLVPAGEDLSQYGEIANESWQNLDAIVCKFQLL